MGSSKSLFRVDHSRISRDASASRVTSRHSVIGYKDGSTLPSRKESPGTRSGSTGKPALYGVAGIWMWDAQSTAPGPACCRDDALRCSDTMAGLG